jgi:hypothetical protein
VNAAGSANTDLTNTQATENAQATAPEAAAQNPNLEKEMSLHCGLGAGISYAGSRDGSLFPSKETDYDYMNYFLQCGPKWDVGVWGDAGEYRLRLGGLAEIGRIEGNDNTPPGTSLTTLSALFRPEFSWRGVWGEGAFAGPSAVWLQGGIGYAWGKDNFGTGSIHDQSAVGWLFRGGVDVVSVAAGGAEASLAPFFQTFIADGKNNSPRLGFGGLIDIHGAREEVAAREIVDCSDEKFDIADTKRKINELLDENKEDGMKKLEQRTGKLRAYLEGRKENPFNQANVVKALRLGKVVELLDNGQNKDALNQAVTQASKEPSSENWVAIFSKVEGVEASQVEPAIKAAHDKYPDNHDFWKLPPVDSDEAIKGKMNLKDTECRTKEDEKAQRKLARDLEEILNKLRERKGAVEKQYEHVVHLAGLVLGAEDVAVAFRMINFNVKEPRYVFAKPTDADIAKLESTLAAKGGNATEADIAAATKGIFNAPAHEAKKLKELADWMNNKGPIPGAEQTDQILAQMGVKPQQKDAIAKKVEEEFVKRVALNVAGFADKRGNDANNQALSERRAVTVIRVLKALGVSGERLKAKGFGELFPVCPEDTDDCYSRSRRVEFLLSDQGPQAPSRESYPDYNKEGVPESKGPAREGGTTPAPAAAPPAAGGKTQKVNAGIQVQ